MTVINTNTAAALTANALTKNERSMSQAMERLSTGQRINSASDDAAGLAISSRMTSQINGLNQAVRNANDGISMLQTADGAIVEITNMLQRMRELTVQVASGTAVAADRAAADVEFDALRLEIERIADQTQYNGSLLLNGSIGSSGAVAFQVGANADQTVTHTFSDYQTADATDSTSNPLGALDNTGDGTDDNDGLTNTLHDLTTASNHDETLDGLTSAINNVNARRAAIGSMINRLEFAVDNLSNVSQNASASRSRILDADYASETTELARTQIIQQAATAMLSQANQQAQSVLALLK
jgi:flagellin